MATIPENFRQAVIQELYHRFDTLRWEQLSNTERSVEYARFVENPKIGGVLYRYLNAGDIRVWIKDGPAKEYRRALQGVGPYAAFTARRTPGPDHVVKAALGPEWSADMDSVSDKPMRCWARHTEKQGRFLIWGDSGSLKELIWHAVIFCTEHPETSPTLVITRPSTAPLSAEVWTQVQEMAAVVGADVAQVTHAASRKGS